MPRRLRRMSLATAFALATLSPHIASAQGGPPPMPVTVAQPVSKRVTQWDEYSGRFEAVQSVEVRPRVTGFIETIAFKDGAVVKAGDLLFTIDRRSFEIAVESARAEVARATAQVELAEAELDRGTPLARTGTVTQRDLDQRRANLSVARASLQVSQATVKSAELNLEWTQVRAPIDGRISDRKVDVGNLVVGGQGVPSATLLTTIVSLDPIHFLFDVSEADYLRYARLFIDKTRPSSRDVNNPVRVRLADETVWTRTGRMDFVDNQLSARSGTLRGRAIFDNRDQILTPGVFARLQLFGGEFDGVLVPDSAIIADQARKIVLSVGDDNVVKPIPVVLGDIVDGLRVIRSGLKAEDKVIIEGLANPMVRPGVKVAPQPGQIKSVAAN